MTPTYEQYKGAADRIRSGREEEGDEEVCESWGNQKTTQVEQPRTIWDLPIAKTIWQQDKEQR